MKFFIVFALLISLSASAENSECRDQVKEQLFKDITNSGMDSPILFDSSKPKECRLEKFKQNIEYASVPDPGGPDEKGGNGTVFVWDNLSTTTRNSRGVYDDQCNKSADNFSSGGERNVSANSWDYIQESNKEVQRIIKSWDSNIDNIFVQTEQFKNDMQEYSRDLSRYRFDKLKPKEKKSLQAELNERYGKIYLGKSSQSGFGYFHERFIDCPTTINYLLGLQDYASNCSAALTKSLPSDGKCDAKEILKANFPKTEYECTWSPKVKGNFEEPKSVSLKIEGKDTNRKLQKCSKDLDCVGKNKKKFQSVAVCRSEYCASSSPAMCINDEVYQADDLSGDQVKKETNTERLNRRTREVEGSKSAR